MKTILFLSLLLPGLLPADNNRTFIDPTGTYTLKGEVKDNKIVSHSGEIRVKLLGHDRLTLCFFIDKGFPGYESGSFLDTLHYEENVATYSTGDSACMISFRFRPGGVEMVHIFSQSGNDCGFSPGVLTGAFFRKTSSGVPVIQDLSGMRAMSHR